MGDDGNIPIFSRPSETSGVTPSLPGIFPPFDRYAFAGLLSNKVHFLADEAKRLPFRFVPPFLLLVSSFSEKGNVHFNPAPSFLPQPQETRSIKCIGVQSDPPLAVYEREKAAG